MNAIRYCTPEWLEQSKQAYLADPSFQEKLAKVTSRIFFRILAEPGWGIQEAMLFGAVVEEGVLHDLRFFSEEEGTAMADFIMAAPPQKWKKILRKEQKFLTEFMLGKVALEHGSKVGVLGLAPYAPIFIDALTQFPLQFPDEMSESELETFQSDLADFRTQANL